MSCTSSLVSSDKILEWAEETNEKEFKVIEETFAEEVKKERGSEVDTSSFVNPVFEFVPGGLRVEFTGLYLNDPPTRRLKIAYKNAQCKVFNMLNLGVAKSCLSLVQKVDASDPEC
eukprot:1025827-Rhodomonas_salina.1